VGISVDSPEESKLLMGELGLSFPLLSDPNATVIEKFGVKMAHEQLAVPAVFVIGTDGGIVWRFVSETRSDRPPEQRVLDVLADLDND
jgi:peroxiredoxin